ncbi:soluble lytic murein transglycosylase [Gammaproteobacteria bacterium]
MKHSPKILVLSILLLSSYLPANADLSQQRFEFREAREARARGDLTLFNQRLASLTEYPLYGYLVYDDLKDRLASASDPEIRAFLARYGDLPVATTLRATWLKHLAEEGRWSDFLDNYRETQDIALRCLEVQARLPRDDASPVQPKPSIVWLEEVRKLWIAQPNTAVSECGTVFDVWQESGGATPNEVWPRVVSAFEAGNPSLAEQIGKRLPEEEQDWVRVWSRIHRDPRSGFSDPMLVSDTPRARKILRHGLIRLSRNEVASAAERWNSLKERYSFDAGDRTLVAKAIALRAVAERHPRALEFLERVPNPDAEVRRAKIRTALWLGDWQAVLRHVRALKPWERSADRWRFWEARALGETGNPGSQEIYEEVATHRGYHGFLAADRIHHSYVFNHRPLEVGEEELSRLSRHPNFVRAHEFFLLGYSTDGRREWMAALPSNSNSTEFAGIARLAAQWSLPDRIIATLGKSTEEDDLVLRFPLEYRDLVQAHAAEVGLPPSTVYAIVRQESVFMTDIRSSAGAVGLMQLMPATATQVAKGLKVSFRNSDLLDPDRNIRLGSTFLAGLVQKQGSLALAAAAYNAGPGRVKEWRPPYKMSADVWIESIPFDETRRYVRNILTYASIYDWRLGRPIARLSDAMPTFISISMREKPRPSGRG